MLTAGSRDGLRPARFPVSAGSNLGQGVVDADESSIDGEWSEKSGDNSDEYEGLTAESEGYEVTGGYLNRQSGIGEGSGDIRWITGIVDDLVDLS